ncbi:hypothetical protein AV530_011455 [Patagioenas fasciata monilis]|uniref:Uncharacterized protein n=1 Tax=Patagioenas fasciata monilis TaxID=372326 RepID=A0A1V4KPG0_PATFA|nr:hypothetical protein AV530_011455 [Patagioenas fasciata monilis]
MPTADPRPLGAPFPPFRKGKKARRGTAGEEAGFLRSQLLEGLPLFNAAVESIRCYVVDFTAAECTVYTLQTPRDRQLKKCSLISWKPIIGFEWVPGEAEEDGAGGHCKPKA